MSSRTDYRNALQALTTTVVKAEVAQESDPAEFEELRSASVEQRQRLQATHELVTAEVIATGAKRFPHAGWLEKTLTRAEALFGPPPPPAAVDLDAEKTDG